MAFSNNAFPCKEKMTFACKTEGHFVKMSAWGVISFLLTGLIACHIPFISSSFKYLQSLVLKKIQKAQGREEQQLEKGNESLF